MTSIIVLPGEVRFWMEVVQGEVLDPAEPRVQPCPVNFDRQTVRQLSDVSIPQSRQRPGSATCKIWVREADGQERAHNLEAIEADLRIGHSVGLIYGAVVGTRRGSLLAALNLTTGGFSCSDSSDSERVTKTGLLSAYVSRRKTWVAGIAVALFFGMLCYVFVGSWLGMMAGLGILPVTASALAWKRRRWARRMVAYVNERALHVLLSKCEFD